jgi:hypothetical protein
VRARRVREERLDGYAEYRNQPDLPITSRLSPWLHFGHLGPRDVAVAPTPITPSGSPRRFPRRVPRPTRARRNNFTLRKSSVANTLAGRPAWALKSLDEHRKDPRPYLCGEATLSTAATHDDLLERRPNRDDDDRTHAPLRPDVLGEEDPRMVPDARSRLRRRAADERRLRVGWTRSEQDSPESRGPSAGSTTALGPRPDPVFGMVRSSMTDGEALERSSTRRLHRPGSMAPGGLFG